MDPLTLADLDRFYPAPIPEARAKSLDHVDRNGREFIALSPLCIVGSTGPDGSVDVSPRGGEAGFAHVSDDGRAVFIPDRHGNNRLDTLRNLLGGAGRIGLLFLVPGFDDTFRVNGRASATADGALLSKFVEFGKTPRLVLRIDVEEAFPHCPKAFMRSRLWKPDAWKPTDGLSSVVRRMSDRAKADDVSLTVNEAVDMLEKDL